MKEYGCVLRPPALWVSFVFPSTGFLSLEETDVEIRVC